MRSGSHCTYGFANQDAFHLFTTHSMRPFEGLNAKKGSSETKMFNMWLDAAIGSDHNFREVDPLSFPAILHGIEVLWRLMFTIQIPQNLPHRLSNGIDFLVCYVKPTPSRSMIFQIAGSAATLEFCQGLRSNISTYAEFEVVAPWLLSLDPMSYSTASLGTRPSNDFHESDFELIAPVVDEFLKSPHPGSMCLFCYSLVKETEVKFRSASSKFSERFKIEPLFLAIEGKRFFTDYKHHVGFVLSNSSHIRSTLSTQWDRVIAGPKKCLEKSFNPTK